MLPEGSAGRRGSRSTRTGTLYVVDALAGASGIYPRVPATARRELVRRGDGVVGLAFDPARGVARGRFERHRAYRLRAGRAKAGTTVARHDA